MQLDRERLALIIAHTIVGPDAVNPHHTDKLAVEAILADIEAQGFVVVPKEPTPEMVDRFVSRALCVSIHSDGGWSNYAMEQWRAMIEAGKEKI